MALASAGSISSVLSIFIDREKFTSRCLATLLDFLRSSALQNKLSCKKSKHSNIDVTHSQMLGKFEYTRGPIFKVVLEC